MEPGPAVRAAAEAVAATSDASVVDITTPGPAGDVLAAGISLPALKRALEAIRAELPADTPEAQVLAECLWRCRLGYGKVPVAGGGASYCWVWGARDAPLQPGFHRLSKKALALLDPDKKVKGIKAQRLQATPADLQALRTLTRPAGRGTFEWPALDVRALGLPTAASATTTAEDEDAPVPKPPPAPRAKAVAGAAAVPRAQEIMARRVALAWAEYDVLSNTASGEGRGCFWLQTSATAGRVSPALPQGLRTRLGGFPDDFYINVDETDALAADDAGGDHWPCLPVVKALAVASMVPQYMMQGYVRWSAQHGLTTLDSATLEATIAAWRTDLHHDTDRDALVAELASADRFKLRLALGGSVVFQTARVLLVLLTLGERVLRLRANVPVPCHGLTCALTGLPLAQGQRALVLDLQLQPPPSPFGLPPPAPSGSSSTNAPNPALELPVVTVVVAMESSGAYPLLPPLGQLSPKKVRRPPVATLAAAEEDEPPAKRVATLASKGVFHGRHPVLTAAGLIVRGSALYVAFSRAAQPWRDDPTAEQMREALACVTYDALFHWTKSETRLSLDALTAVAHTFIAPLADVPPDEVPGRDLDDRLVLVGVPHMFTFGRRLRKSLEAAPIVTLKQAQAEPRYLAAFAALFLVRTQAAAAPGSV